MSADVALCMQNSPKSFAEGENGEAKYE